ncbi:MAG: YidB family protein [Vicinamibacteria bacterium]
MGLLDELLAQAGATATAAGPAATPHADLAKAVLDMLGNQQGGGLAGLAQTFQQKGLGDVMSSWVSNGPNQPISADQVQHGLGGDLLTQLSQKVGVSPAVAASALTVVLPMIVNKLTPQGSVPAQHSLLQDGIALLQSQLARR